MERRTNSPYPTLDRPVLALVGVLLVISTVLFTWSDRAHDWRYYQWAFRTLVAEKYGDEKARTVANGLQQIWVAEGFYTPVAQDLPIQLVPGVEVRVVTIAPLGDPLRIEIRGGQWSIRRAEAAQIEVESGALRTPSPELARPAATSDDKPAPIAARVAQSTDLPAITATTPTS